MLEITQALLKIWDVRRYFRDLKEPFDFVVKFFTIFQGFKNLMAKLLRISLAKSMQMNAEMRYTNAAFGSRLGLTGTLLVTNQPRLERFKEHLFAGRAVLLF